MVIFLYKNGDIPGSYVSLPAIPMAQTALQVDPCGATCFASTSIGTSTNLQGGASPVKTGG